MITSLNEQFWFPKVPDIIEIAKSIQYDKGIRKKREIEMKEDITFKPLFKTQIFNRFSCVLFLAYNFF